MGQRESQIELLRLISMFCIVLYHLLFIYVYPETQEPIYRAMQMPLHVGVIVFVLISGYFTIRPTSKGLIKLLGIFFVYNLPELVFNIINAEGASEIIQASMFLSNTHYWFIKAYLSLFLVSPLLNLFLEHATDKQRWYVVIALFFVVSYMAMTGGDKAMVNGKNVANFMYLYLVGNQINKYEYKWKEWKTSFLVVSYVLLNLLIVWANMVDTVDKSLLWTLSYQYSSPVLLVNAILLFMIFGKTRFTNKWVNYAAGSALAIYLVHENKPYGRFILDHLTQYILQITSSPVCVMALCIILALSIMLSVIIIDKCLTPIWKIINDFGQRIYMKLGF